jgi:hypothetical protein
MADRTCNVDGCNRTGALKRGWCGGHYRRWQRYGDVGSAALGRTRATCSVGDCARPAASRNLCKAHLHRLERHGDVQADLPVVSKRPPGTAGSCVVAGCDFPAKSRYCTAHAARLRTKGDVLADVPVRRRGILCSDPCRVDGCARVAMNFSLCAAHYKRWRRNGDPGVAAIRPVRPRRIQGLNCSVSSCDRNARSAGLCRAHYCRWQRTGDVRADRAILGAGKRSTQPCSIDGCARLPYGRSWCFIHYQRWHRTGNPLGMQPHRIFRAKSAPTIARHRTMMLRTTKEDRAIMAAYKATLAKDPCLYCGAGSEHADHYYPVSRGGSYQWWALVPACASCNQSKNARCGTWFALRGDATRQMRTFSRTLATA